MIINKNRFKIIIKNNISKLSEGEILKICAITDTITTVEARKNIVRSALIHIKISDGTNVIINIKKHIEPLIIGDLIKFLSKFKQNYSEQSTESRAMLNEYMEDVEETSQEIVYEFEFDLETNIHEINEEMIPILEVLKLSNKNSRLFK